MRRDQVLIRRNIEIILIKSLVRRNPKRSKNMRLILSEKDKHIIVSVLGDYATEIDRQATKSKEDLDTYKRIENIISQVAFGFDKEEKEE